MGTQHEPARLGCTIAASTVWEILHAPSIDAAFPKDRADLAAVPQAHAIIAGDFFTIETVLLKPLYVLIFIEHRTRHLHLAGVTAYPTTDHSASRSGRFTHPRSHPRRRSVRQRC
jgi:putative transposase